MLYPRHYLQKKGSTLTVFTEHRDDLSRKLYLVSPDGALREGSENNKPRLPANQARTSEGPLNPFFVVLSTEIAFHRFRRNPHLLYFKPLVGQIEWKLNKTHLTYSTDMEGDDNMEGTVDEFGMVTL